MGTPLTTNARRRWARSRVGAVAVLAVVGALAVPSAPARAALAGNATGRVDSPASLVNPMIGTSGSVDTFPGPDVPFGMLQWSPDTAPTRAHGGGYEYQNTAISGFSLSHISGPGSPVAGDIPILPVVGDAGANPGSLTAPFSHEGERARAGYYRVTTGSGDSAVTTRLTSSTRAGIGTFTFPKTTQAQLVVKLNGGATRVDGTSASVRGSNELIGSVTSGHFCVQCGPLENDYTLHFDLRFNRPFTATAYGSTANGGPAGEVLTFDTTSTPTLVAKVGISYTSDANAIANLAAEIPTWSFAATHDAAVAAWDNMLGRIEVAGGTRDQQVQFYTALYHALLHPNVFSDDNGQYAGFDGAVHTAAKGHTQYANFSGWDTYRSQVQLAALVAPQQTSDSIRSMLNDYDQSGQLPKWAVNNGESFVMVGDPADPIIADAYAFGARDFDARHALAAMVDEATHLNNIRPAETARDAYGYIPYDKNAGCCHYYGGPVSTELEYDSDDYAIAALANSLGNTRVYSRFATRAQDWQHVFNPATGYVQGKLASGQWLPGFTPGTAAGMVEGTAAQYTPMVPFNIRALANARGGNAAWSSYLDGLFTSIAHPSTTNANLSNEASLEIPWEYDWIGEPWKTQQVVREAQQQLYFDAPAGQFGNDDLGAMSSWYVWSELGMYPETPGSGTLALGSPVFPLTEVHLANGKTLTITAPRAAPASPYVQSMTVSGRPWTKPWTTYDRIDRGQRLDFVLGSSPDVNWGADPSSAPPSDRTGESPVLASVDQPIVVARPGGSAQATITATNVSREKHTVTWTASPQPGVSAAPAHGHITLAAGGTATVPVTITAAADSHGRYPVNVSFSTGRDRLADSATSAAVAEPGEIWPYFTNAGITDDADTDAATFDGGGWSYSAQSLAAQHVVPGSTVSADGVDYTWPDVPPATFDNIEMGGQTIPLKLPAGATKIGLLGAASSAGGLGAGGTVTVNYTDGTTSTFSAMFSDWMLAFGLRQPVSGNIKVITATSRNGADNQHNNLKPYVFGIDADLTAGKTVASITLPVATGGDAHVFAIGSDGASA